MWFRSFALSTWWEDETGRDGAKSKSACYDRVEHWLNQEGGRLRLQFEGHLRLERDQAESSEGRPAIEVACGALSAYRSPARRSWQGRRRERRLKRESVTSLSEVIESFRFRHKLSPRVFTTLRQTSST